MKYKTKIADESWETHIVAWFVGKNDAVDHWEAFDDMASARKRYDEVEADPTVELVSIATVVKSTDYICKGDTFREGSV